MFSQIAEVQPELLAHHFSEAGLFTEAIEWWERAALRSARRSDNIEAPSEGAPGGLVVGSALMLPRPFAAERVSPSTRERVRVSIRSRKHAIDTHVPAWYRGLSVGVLTPAEHRRRVG